MVATAVDHEHRVTPRELFFDLVFGLAALALVTAVWLALHTYELVWWRQARAESRSLLAS